MSELSTEARALIDAGRTDIASAATKARVKTAVLAQVGTAPPAGSTGTVAGGAKLLGAGVLTLGLVAGALYTLQPSVEAPAPRAEVAMAPVAEVSEVDAVDVAVAPVSEAPEVEAVDIPVAPVSEAPEVEAVGIAEPEAPAPTPEPRAAPAPKKAFRPARTAPVAAAPAVVAPAAVDVSRLAEEARLLKKVRRALRDGHHNEVLALTRQHAEGFPQGALVAERLAAEAMAHCGLGDLAAGRAARATLVARAPTSIHLARVDELCR